VYRLAKNDRQGLLYKGEQLPWTKSVLKNLPKIPILYRVSTITATGGASDARSFPGV
jgi:hypothetical protein